MARIQENKQKLEKDPWVGLDDGLSRWLQSGSYIRIQRIEGNMMTRNLNREAEITNENSGVGKYSNWNKKFTRWGHKLVQCGRTRVSGLKETLTEILQSSEQKEKTSKKNEQNVRFCFDSTQKQTKN